MMRRVVLAALAAVLVTGAGFAALAYHAPIGPVQPAAPDPALIARGAQVAAVGDCAVCHAGAHGPFGGGRRLQTPFGALYSTNITPDAATGIGTWSLAAFTRAMRTGVDRAGGMLYPAFPFDHFTRLSDGDLAALYAYLQSRPAVQAVAPANELAFPLGWRPLVSGWRLLFLDNARFEPDPSQDAVWNRGAYLVEAAGHCGACHTPRNAMGAERVGAALQGGEAEGWSVPPLAGSGWSAAAFYAYLRPGALASPAAAAGPMGAVLWNLARLPDADVRAMALYLASRAGPPRPAVQEAPAAAPGSPGAVIFAGACASCHGPATPLTRLGAPSLASSASLQSDAPGNVLRVILGGLAQEHGGVLMPAYGTMLTDAQVADLAAYLRARYAPGRPAWPGVAGEAHRLRTEGGA